jgi:hypothetical protein
MKIPFLRYLQCVRRMRVSRISDFLSLNGERILPGELRAVNPEPSGVGRATRSSARRGTNSNPETVVGMERRRTEDRVALP